MASAPDFSEALRARAAELRRKLQEERQAQEAAQQETASVEDEVASLRDEALQLQLGADRQRQERRAQREDKIDVASLRREVSRRQNQVAILTEELARVQAHVRRLVDEAVERTEKAALGREADMELQWSAREDVEKDKLRQADLAALDLEQESASLEHDMRILPARTAAVQLFAVLDELQHNREVAQFVQRCQHEEQDFLDQRSRRLGEKDAKLAQLEREAAERRCQATESQRCLEAEACKEQAELTERLERNRKRAERAEREASRHLKELRGGPSRSQEGREHRSSALPPVDPRASGSLGSRSAMPEFALAGALKALDQELHGQRFGLLTRSMADTP